MEDSKDRVQENLLANGGRCYNVQMFLKCFIFGYLVSSGNRGDL